MRYIFTGDQHFSLYSSFSKPDSDYGNTRFHEQITTLHKVFQLAIEKQATLLFGGDLFDQRGTVNTLVFNKVFAVFQQYSDIKVIMIRGNHDSMTNHQYAESSPEPFSVLPNLTYVNGLELVENGLDSILCVSYGDEVEESKQFIQENANHGGATILMGHLGVENALTGAYSHRLGGAFGLGDLHPEAYKYVALGHYHRRQFLDDNHRVFYSGSLVPNSFSDEGQEKGVMYFDTESKTEPEFIPIKNKLFITLTGQDLTEGFEELMLNNYVSYRGSVEEVETITALGGEVPSNVRMEIVRPVTTDTRIDIDVNSEPVTVAQEYAKKFMPEAESSLVNYVRKAEVI